MPTLTQANAGRGEKKWSQNILALGLGNGLLHINAKELLAVEKALRLFSIESSRTLNDYTDNVTVLFLLKAWGSRSSPALSLQMGPLLKFSFQKDREIVPVRIPTSVNVVAAGLSRDNILPSEWSLQESTRKNLFAWAGMHQIDLMATPYNRQVHQIVSPIAHSEAVKVSIRGMIWDRETFVYLFLPHFLPNNELITKIVLPL